MNLKFIGTDGSMGLKHGEVYEVSLVSCFSDPIIVVSWYEGLEKRKCPYSSPAAFAANWAKPEPALKVTVRKKTAIEDSDAYSKYKRVIKRMKTVTLLDLFLAGFGGKDGKD